MRNDPVQLGASLTRCALVKRRLAHALQKVAHAIKHPRRGADGDGHESGASAHVPDRGNAGNQEGRAQPRGRYSRRTLSTRTAEGAIRFQDECLVPAPMVIEPYPNNGATPAAANASSRSRLFLPVPRGARVYA